MIRACAAAAVCFAALAVPPADAQDAAPLVRVSVAGGDVVQGYLRANSAHELVVFTSGREYRHVPHAEIRRYEVRERMGSHVKRGALMGVFLWASLMFAASIDELEDAGPASWQSAAVLAGGVGLGAAIGKGVPRHGWRETTRPNLPPPSISLSFRF
jgi:hypothetical protein